MFFQGKQTEGRKEEVKTKPVSFAPLCIKENELIIIIWLTTVPLTVRFVCSTQLAKQAIDIQA